MSDICAVIVTFNRLDLLKKALNALNSQVKPFRKIYIIDNASTDNTSDWCVTYKKNTGDRIEYIRLNNNEGGAGGFNYGITKAYEDLDNNWFVVLDDDAILPTDFNNHLDKAIEDNKNIWCFTGNVTRMEKGVKLKRVMEDCEYTYVDKVSFVSAVFKRDLIDIIGFPEKDYFIWFDDNEYSLRARKYSKIVSVNYAVVEHLQGDASNDSLLWKKYYGIRNELHMIHKHSGCIKYYTIRCFMWMKLWASSVIKQLIMEKSITRFRARRTLIRDAFRDSKINKLGINAKYLPGGKQ